MPSKDPLSDVDPELFVRVKDKDTGHEYDVRARNFRPDVQELVKSEEYPPSQTQRAGKHNVTKAGKPVPSGSGN